MKNYTIHFLILFLVTLALGFTGLEFTGAAIVRFIALVSGIALLLSCLDAVLISKRMKRRELRTQKIPLKKNS